MDRVDSQRVYEGKIVTVRIDSFRQPDASVREREIVAHPGAVVIAAHDDERLYMVRQPREAVGEDALLELPAGKLDEGESPLESAKRELREEVGLEAAEWRELKRIYSSPGFTDEQVYVFEATGLQRVGADPGAGEDIEVVEVPMSELDRAVEGTNDAKSLVGLLLLMRGD